VTIGVIRALRELGRHHDTALIGFDDVPLGDLLEPGVTVVAQDPQEIGRIAASGSSRDSTATTPPRHARSCRPD
jgi:DNA-binding LacI/PurR family transcriptional regulator